MPLPTLLSMSGVIRNFKGFYRAELTNESLDLLEIDPAASAEKSVEDQPLSSL